MKNLIYLALTVLIISCSSDDSSSSNNANDVDYFFEIELAGTTYRVQGNTAEHTPYYPGQNQCSTLLWRTTLGIADKTASDYVSGEHLSLNISLDNAQLGSNTGTLDNFSNSSFFFANYLESIGGTPALGFIENGPLTVPEASGLANKISNINITDLGTETHFVTGTQDIDWGETVKGTYEGVIWFANATTFNYDIPVPITIEFNSVRVPQQ